MTAPHSTHLGGSRHPNAYTPSIAVTYFQLPSCSLLHTLVLPLLFEGVLTGMSPAGFSISLNERELGGEPVVDFLEAVLRKAASPAHLIRDVSTK